MEIDELEIQINMDNYMDIDEVGSRRKKRKVSKEVEGLISPQKRFRFTTSTKKRKVEERPLRRQKKRPQKRLRQCGFVPNKYHFQKETAMPNQAWPNTVLHHYKF